MQIIVVMCRMKSSTQLSYFFVALFYIFIFTALIPVLTIARGMGSVQLVFPFQAKCIVSVTSIGKAKPVIFRTVKLTVGAQIMATVI